MGALYKITFLNGKAYIGITSKDTKARIRAHIKHTRSDRRQAVHRAIRKYGEDGFSVETLLISNDWAYLTDMEKSAIVAFDTRVPNGYNITRGGDGTLGVRRTKSEEERRKIGDARRLRVHPPWSEESKHKLRAARAGRLMPPWTPERRAKTLAAMSAALKGVKRKPLSNEHRANIGAANKGRKMPPRSLEHIEKIKAFAARPWSAARRAKFELKNVKARKS